MLDLLRVEAPPSGLTLNGNWTLLSKEELPMMRGLDHWAHKSREEHQSLIRFHTLIAQIGDSHPDSFYAATL